MGFYSQFLFRIRVDTTRALFVVDKFHILGPFPYSCNELYLLTIAGRYRSLRDPARVLELKPVGERSVTRHSRYRPGDLLLKLPLAIFAIAQRPLVVEVVLHPVVVERLQVAEALAHEAKLLVRP